LGKSAATIFIKNNLNIKKMKKLYTAALVLFIALSFSAKKSTLQEKENKLVATFKSITVMGFYKFVDDKDVSYLFYDLAEDIEISLEDESSLNKKFSIKWTTKQIDELDEDGEETGERITVKSILSIIEE
jgi:hypothetical protein